MSDKSPIAKLLIDQKQAYSIYETSIINLEKELLGKLKDLEDDKLVLNNKKLDLEIREKKLIDRELAEQKKIDELNALTIKNERQLADIESSSKKLDEKDKALNSKIEAFSVTSKEFQLEREDLRKRTSFIEMEERRLKYFESKINTIAQDEEIKKKLKELS